ncbi:MAG: helix-turn-helix domain-containing protein [Thiohalomonas sp.]|nr:helix-turn-helix domain-containing protein [Thiohalomonas sp.]
MKMLDFHREEAQNYPMTQITLTAHEKSALEMQHKHSRNGKERDRIKAILLCSEGWKVPMIAQALRIHETSILRHIKDYKGSEKLTTKSGGSSSKLSAEQTEQLIAHLTEQTYHHQKDIVAYIPNQLENAGSNTWKLSLDSRINDNFQVFDPAFSS